VEIQDVTGLWFIIAHFELSLAPIALATSLAISIAIAIATSLAISIAISIAISLATSFVASLVTPLVASLVASVVLAVSTANGWTFARSLVNLIHDCDNKILVYPRLCGRRLLRPPL